MNLLRRIVLGSDLRATLQRAIILALAIVLITRYIALPVRVGGASMEPTIRDRSFHVANLLHFAGREPKRGDVVVISMTGMKALYLKRIIGLPGETVSFLDGQLFINGLPRHEPYLPERGAWRVPAVVVGPEEFFVAGDNRKIPAEDHAFGLVHKKHVKGGLWF